MSISFDRNNAQVLCENFVGALSAEEFSNKKMEFESLYLTLDMVELLDRALSEDSLNFFYNGIVSFSEGLDAVLDKRFSWAVVELYYSIYYFIRASLAAKGIALIRLKRMYRLLSRVGESPFTTNNKRYNTTHEGTINHYKDLFGNSDKLLSNNIDDLDAYQWMMNLREIINYRCNMFSEPDCLSVWDYYLQSIEDDSFECTLESLERDPYIMCFQEEYAVLAIPVKRLILTVKDLIDNNIDFHYSDEKLEYIKKIYRYDERKIEVIKQVL